MPLQATSGAATYDAFGGGVPVVPNYIEDVFSTWLYTGNGSTQTITNGIDLSGNGGLVWIKGRSGATGHRLVNTVRGATKSLESNSTTAEATESTGLTSFSATGFALGADADYNTNAATYVSWAFREQAKFFDVVTYTGDGTAGRTISHSLGSTPGCIIVKNTSSAGYNWAVYHRSLTSNQYALQLQATAAQLFKTAYWNSTSPTSTVFTVGDDADVNESGQVYVAYLFAHNAGGFGLTGTDNVISCDGFTHTTSSTQSINLGYEPQWVLLKRRTSGTDNWFLMDTMRGLTVANTVNLLNPNLSAAEGSSSDYLIPTATGFDVRPGLGPDGATYIYIAIRRGPMKTPTTGTSVFGLNARSGTGANATVTGGQVDDAVLIKNRGSAVGDLFAARLTDTNYLETSSTAAQVAAGTTILQANPWDVMDGVKVGTTSTITNASSNTFINYLFRRAPGFFDVVCYTGTGSATTFSHNLGVVPELMIVKIRNQPGAAWAVYNAASGNTKVIRLNTTAAQTTSSAYWNNTTPTVSVFTVGNDGDVNNAGDTYVAYLFATVAGVSKVGGYTGTGTTLQIDCGFTAGARFVLIKRTDSTGDWYVWDSARGIVAGNDPYLLLNSTAAEVTNTDYVDTYSAGFEISSTAPAAINANGGTFIFLAIA